MRIFSRLYFAILITVLASLISCRGGSQNGLDESRLCIPVDLEIDSVRGQYAKVAWNPGCPGERLFIGFNLYLSRIPLAKSYPGRNLPKEIKPYNHEIYPGDTEGNSRRETFEFEEIESATRYFAHARIVYSDESLSLPSNEIELICYPQGELELAVSYSGGNDGYSFVNDRLCRTDDLENDIYYYTKGGKDYLCSASKLGAINRNNRLYHTQKDGGEADLQNLKKSGDALEKIEVNPGDDLVLITEENHFVGLRVKRFSGSGDDRKIIIEYFYKPPVAGADLSS